MVRNLKAAQAAGRLTNHKLGAFTCGRASSLATRLATSPSKEAKANLAFQVISKGQEKGSIILMSNKTSASGGQVFGGEALATAILEQPQLPAQEPPQGRGARE
ncbi:ATP-binding protein [Streptomyces sp. NBC_01005]|uniref:ATP-binding protein n=1 Tax=unclassified Streptomyces TaxID=2593676 RepID=UPI002E31D67D|nr:ATP-binding protein [Streptomyces sp. NBC_01362]WSW09579.1 ATP-binding protein [Streptomyces sp. NBC_01005]WTC99084.1 ATP-binding protein [Streptomyces sp. NBC_01650]